ncbi:hypothetical protein GCM10023224_31480 [Streptomonospora halophila]|uniref:Excreted virulence factor EspC, type VII ESX diderm n=1 Tax=Streptomonospora halophila TaxID=427369 RepID=A0ABP9GKM0_9ACTN
MNASNQDSSDYSHSKALFALPEELARSGSELYAPANAVDEIKRRYQTFRQGLDPLWGEDEMSQKLEKNTDPLEENLMLYLDHLGEGLRTCADYTMQTGRSMEVVDESAADTGKSLKSDMGDVDGGGGKGGRW